MKERQREHERIGCRPAPRPRERIDVRADGPKGQFHSLALRGRAGGVDQQGEVLVLRRRWAEVRFADKEIVPGPVPTRAGCRRRRSADFDAGNANAAASQRVQYLDVFGAHIHDDRAGAGVLQNVANFGVPVACVDRNVNRTNAVRPEQSNNELERARQQTSDTIAVPDADRPQTGGVSTRQDVELPEGQRRVAETERDGVGACLELSKDRRDPSRRGLADLRIRRATLGHRR